LGKPVTVTLETIGILGTLPTEFFQEVLICRENDFMLGKKQNTFLLTSQGQKSQATLGRWQES
jgi:hypothetical protein